jgi:NIMA (never in mitosis gene a)-related kinase
MSLAPPSSGGSMARYQRVKVLGQGSYGRAILVKETAGQRLFVIKEVDLSRGSQRDEALREVQFMSVLCQHPYIVELKEWFEDRPAKKLYIVMRYCDGGDLSSKVQKRRGVLLPESQVLHLFIQICLGLKHIHDRKILYRFLSFYFLSSSSVLC